MPSTCIHGNKGLCLDIVHKIAADCWVCHATSSAFRQSNCLARTEAQTTVNTQCRLLKQNIWQQQTTVWSQRHNESLPPAVVFTAKLKVAQHDCDFCTGDDEDHKDEAQEAKEVVELV